MYLHIISHYFEAPSVTELVKEASPSPLALPEAAEEGRVGKNPEKETRVKNFMEKSGEFSCQSSINYPVGKPLEVIWN